VLSLFIAYQDEFNSIVKLVEKLTGKNIEVTCDEISEKFSFQMFDIEFILMGRHDLEDDFGIPFTNYEIQLNMIQLSSGQEIDSYLKMFTSLSLYLAERISKEFNTEVLIVEDLQEIVCKYDKGMSV
jgi:hypothetical protein